VNIAFTDRLTIAPAYTEISFSREEQKWLAVSVPEQADYTLKWSDSGDGDDTGTMDVLVSFFDASKAATLYSCSDVDNGYTSPVVLTELGAGNYYILLKAKSAAISSGLLKIMMYENE
jgi:hypothetical protein